MNFRSCDDALFDAYLPQLIEQHRRGAEACRALWGDEEMAQMEERIADWLSTASRDEIKAGFANAAKAERKARYESLKEEFGDAV